MIESRIGKMLLQIAKWGWNLDPKKHKIGVRPEDIAELSHHLADQRHKSSDHVTTLVTYLQGRGNHITQIEIHHCGRPYPLVPRALEPGEVALIFTDDS